MVTNLQNIKTDADSIIIVDNPFPSWLEEYIKSQSKIIPWGLKYIHENAAEEFTFTYGSYVHNHFLEDHLHSNKIFNLAFADFITKEMPAELTLVMQGVRWNCLLKTNDANLHVDHSNDDCLTCVYFVNNSDGDLVFYEPNQTTEIKRCTFKQNRIVIFPSNIHHKAFAPTAHKFKITLAVQFYRINP